MCPAAAHALGSSSPGTASGSCSCYAPAPSSIVTILPGLLYTSLLHVGLSVFVLLTTLVLLLFTLSLVTSLLYLCSLSKSSTLIPTLAGQVEDPPAYA